MIVNIIFHADEQRIRETSSSRNCICYSCASLEPYLNATRKIINDVYGVVSSDEEGKRLIVNCAVVCKCDCIFIPGGR